MLQELNYPFDADAIMENRKKLRKQLLQDGEKRIQKKIAILGGSTTHDIMLALELFLLQQGIEPSFYESEYAQGYQDAVFGNPDLDAFRPDVVFIHTTTRNIRVPFPSMGDSAERIDALLAEQMQYHTAMWDAIWEKFHCPIIQNNFEMPAYRLLGNQDARNIHGRTRFVEELNRRFYEEADKRRDFYIHDIHYLSAAYGLDAWSDPFYWYMYKYALCIPAIPQFAFSLSNIIKSIFGKNKKALALDLDNTLWGGVVGDDGVEGLEIGQETSMGQGFYAFGQYLKELQSLGILLNVCSKNDEANALAGLRHPSGVLRPEDFVVIKANWEPKAQNVAEIAKALNILPESIVFVDDNPAERENVRRFLPGVVCPEIGKVEEYIHVLDRSGFFEMTTFSEDDAKRSEMYRANLQREQEMQSFTNYRDYLLDLDMHADITDFTPLYLARITQLTNKSNQFNLTTRRYTESEMESVFASENHIRLCGRLRDKFGDNGIVSVVIGEIRGEELHMDLWLMSCRVLKRDMELAMLDTLVARARERGVRRIIGYYYPTAKNGMVRTLYESFGFTRVREESDGSTVWMLETEPYTAQNSVIAVNQE